ncbi:MAG: L-glutamate gamma-semialdehyde dehydrogenase [Planctomycetes bacterium]|nr:L-glutamate gamma-semialdehyde dehydrogenase [Planctomycetota bacterium]MCB9891619.1 L-glutamate gamma-semialdehyde dehydrogenase [Planctomycetota bacterium]MCB9917884.1 L-glutamate gamma-semialdehyde dehydrogenase [Planctomycetota bacterium]
MSNASFVVPTPLNEPVRAYAPGSSERTSIKAALERMAGDTVEIPMIIGGKEVRSGKIGEVRMPHDHGHVLGTFHQGDVSHVDAAAKAAKAAERDWQEMPWEHRASIFLKAAELLAGPWRDRINASTMLGQSKNVFQAEIDSACELIDFWRFNVHYMRELYAEQPESAPGIWNRIEQRGLEGFVFAVTPFNFTSIAGNLPTAPAMMGTTSIWKPASTAVLSGYWIMKLLEEAGLPAGVVNFVPGSGRTIGDPAIAHPDLAGVHFTGSTGVFQGMWKAIGGNIDKYKCYPRIVGETGGKDFIFAHPSADIEALVAATVRGAFEYQGQKCSAASRAYVPESMWPDFRDRLMAQISQIRMGDVRDFSNFVNAVIDENAFRTISGYIDYAREASDADILCGGECDRSKGWFIQPTVIKTSNPTFKTLCEEIFGPVLTVSVYADSELDETLAACDTASPYALTGAIFSQDRYAAVHMAKRLTHSAGNFYINDKPTGAVVGQQPFGGGRASGTNDKAGSKLNLLRWCSARTIKETFVPPTDWRYPFLGAE